MDSLFLLIFEVMFERVDDMKEIVEHPMSPAGRESSTFALCSPLPKTDSHMTIRRLHGTWDPMQLFFKASGQCIELLRSGWRNLVDHPAAAQEHASDC
jgi:hypothetical protein